MSNENAEIVRRAFEAWDRRDDEAALDHFSPDVEIDASERVLNPGVFHGIDGARRFRAEIDETWVEFHVAIEDVLPAGDDVVVLVRSTGQGRASGAQVDARAAWVVALVDGKVSRLRLYRDRSEALAAATLSNADIVRQTFRRICAHDIDGLLELYHPEVEFLPLTGTRVESGGYSGHSGVRDYFAEADEVWEEMQPHADDVRTVGDQVVVLGGCAVRGRGSGARSDNPMAWVLTLRDGKVTRHLGFATREEALDAAGLSE